MTVIYFITLNIILNNILAQIIMSEPQIHAYIVTLVKIYIVIYNNKQVTKTKNARKKAYEEITKCVNHKFSTNLTRKNLFYLKNFFISITAI